MNISIRLKRFSCAIILAITSVPIVLAQFPFETIKHFNGSDGAQPFATVVEGIDGSLYGTTFDGGGSSRGTVFRLTPDGSGGHTHTVIKTFNGSEGFGPYARVIQDDTGALYGTTYHRGTGGYGVVYRLTPDGAGSFSYTVLHSFNSTDGANPYAGVIRDSSGVIYGTTLYGGSSDHGTVFMLAPDGAGGFVQNVIHHFNATEGAHPFAGVIQDSGGTLYGTTYQGGGSGFGTVFSLMPDGAGGYTHTVLHTFAGLGGQNPYAGLHLGAGGALFGTTFRGGSMNMGTVFKLTPDGGGSYTHTVLHSFSGPDGRNPYAEVTEGSGGFLYGTTVIGGQSGLGTVFGIHADGSDFVTIHSFATTDGAYPYAGLSWRASGILCGTTYQGGDFGEGTVFQLMIDSDGDGVHDDLDNCWSTPNADQADGDADGVGDACDACPSDPANTQVTFTDWTSLESVGPETVTAVGTLGTVTVQLGGSYVQDLGQGTASFPAPYFTPPVSPSDVVWVAVYPTAENYTIDFSQPVHNPVIHLLSFASILDFGTISVTRLSGQNSFVVSGGIVSGTLDLSLDPAAPYYDANGSIQLNGTFSSISFTARYSFGAVDGIGLQLGMLGCNAPVDNTPPTITCPATVNVNTDPGACSASAVNLGTPTANDNSGMVSVSNNAPTTFPLGVTVVIWTATDGVGNTASCEQRVTVTDNQAPSITCPADVSVNTDPGQCFATGVNLGAPITSDNCGVASVANNAPAQFPVGTTVVTWTVTDVNGLTTTCEQRVIVTDNQPPVITCSPDVSVNADLGQSFATGVNLGSPITSDNCGVTGVANNAPAQFPVGTTVVTWTVTDVNGLIATCQQWVTVTDNQPPMITCPADVSVNADAGQCFATGVSLGSPLTSDNCGVASVVNNAPAQFPVGTTVVTWIITDVNGLTATCQQRVTVTSDSCGTGEPQPPIVTISDAPLNPVSIVSQPVTVTGTFTDADDDDLHTAIWSWGDGETTVGTVNQGNNSVSDSHTYALPGVYEVTLTVTDNDGLSGKVIFQYVVIYDPDGGFVTGGGWINSPAGAYTANPSLIGKANFGFVAKYKKGAHIPTGNTEFQFKAGDLNFKSTSYEWLVVAGAKAKFKGSGTINGFGDYAFQLTATDGQVSGGGGYDRFRIKIWDKSGGGVIYDNQPGDADTADATTALGGGSIVVHKP